MVVTHESGGESAPRKKAARKPRKAKPAEAEQAVQEAVGAVPGPEPEPAKGGKRGKQLQAVPVMLGELAERYLEHLEAAGKSHGTLFSYGIELKTACRELGAELPIASLTPERVLLFFQSPRVTMLKSGRPKAKPSIDKTRRVLRLALVWAVEQGWLEKAPLPQMPEPAQ